METLEQPSASTEAVAVATDALLLEDADAAQTLAYIVSKTDALDREEVLRVVAEELVDGSDGLSRADRRELFLFERDRQRHVAQKRLETLRMRLGQPALRSSRLIR